MNNEPLPKLKAPQKVVTIQGNPLPVDEILDADFERLSDMQAAAWRVERDAHEEVARMDQRIKAGAIIRSTNYVWDARNRMVRSKKKGVR